MKIDCARCPMRARACGDCMMQVFFGPPTSGYGVMENNDPAGAELADAIDVFADTELISPEVAGAAKRGVVAGDDTFRESWPGGLRAV